MQRNADAEGRGSLTEPAWLAHCARLVNLGITDVVYVLNGIRTAAGAATSVFPFDSQAREGQTLPVSGAPANGYSSLVELIEYFVRLDIDVHFMVFLCVDEERIRDNAQRTKHLIERLSRDVNVPTGTVFVPRTIHFDAEEWWISRGQLVCDTAAGHVGTHFIDSWLTPCAGQGSDVRRQRPRDGFGLTSLGFLLPHTDRNGPYASLSGLFSRVDVGIPQTYVSAKISRRNIHRLVSSACPAYHNAGGGSRTVVAGQTAVWAELHGSSARCQRARDDGTNVPYYNATQVSERLELWYREVLDQGIQEISVWSSSGLQTEGPTTALVRRLTGCIRTSRVMSSTSGQR